jgi:hypothetical protein
MFTTPDADNTESRKINYWSVSKVLGSKKNEPLNPQDFP